jgi:hypothetical protein
MGGGKSSGSQSANLTPEQTEVLRLQTSALRDTFLPAYQQTVGGAGKALEAASRAGNQSAQTAMDVAGRTGAQQEQLGSGALQGGMSGTANMAAYQQGLGQGLTGAGAGGVGNVANYQQNFGQGMSGAGASQLAQLFSPQYKNEQIQASMQPAREEIREQLGGQNAMFGGAGGLGSSRHALASQNLSQLGQQRLGSVAAQTSAAVEQQRQQAANTMLGAGQSALGQTGGLYQGLLGAGQGASSAAQQGYGALAGQGSGALTSANQAAASRIGYAGTPQDQFAKYASVIFGTPQASTNPNFGGTQGSQGQSKGFKF